MGPKTVIVCTMVLQSIAWGASRSVPGFLKPMGAPRPSRVSWVDQRVWAGKARVELEGEVSIDEMKQFWVGRGLKPNRARWLLKEAEEQPKLRCPDLLQLTLSKLSVVFEGVDINKLCSRFPALLLLDPRIVQERVEALQKMLDRVSARMLALRAAELLLLEPTIVRARLDALQASLPDVDARKLCSKSLNLLMEEDPAGLVAACVKALEEELPGIGPPVQVLVSNPWLLSWSLAAGIQQRQAALTAFVSPSAASALLAQSPYLLGVPPDNLSAILATLAELDPPLPLPQVLSSCPRLLSAEPGDVALSLHSLGAAVPALNMTALVLKEPALLPKLAQGAVDVGERVRQWSEEFPSIEVATLFAKHPPLIGMDVSSVLDKMIVLEEAIAGDDDGGQDLGGEMEEEGPIRDLELDREAILRKAPMLLKEEVTVLQKRATLLREVLGAEDCMGLARSFPRLFMKDFYRNLVPKAQFFARIFPPQTFKALLRDSPQIFFYSTMSIEAKVLKLVKALDETGHGLNATALVTNFPGIVCLDPNKNIRLKVECICSLYPGSEMVQLLEEQPKILVHGFGRISRVVYAAKAGLSAPQALRMITQSWAELSEQRAYLQELGKQELASLTVMEASRGAALRDRLSQGMDRAALMAWEPPAAGDPLFDQYVDDAEDEDGDEQAEEGSGRKDKPVRGFVIPLSKG